jgi:5'-nucleotidase
VNILLSNDDGYKSSGLKALKDVLENYGNVTTVAPHRDISASSSCLSVHGPVEINKISANFYKVYGTPADCVHIASRGILKNIPDIVFSGVNIGSNMGDDVIYSGTVGAAIEGKTF